MPTLCDDESRMQLDGLIQGKVCTDGRFETLQAMCETACGKAMLKAEEMCHGDEVNPCQGPCAGAVEMIMGAGCTDMDMFFDNDRNMPRKVLDMLGDVEKMCTPDGCMAAVAGIGQACDGLDTSSGDEDPLGAIMMLCAPNTPCSEALKAPMMVCSDDDEMWDDGEQKMVNVKEQLGGVQMLCGMMAGLMGENGELDAEGMAALMAMLGGEGGDGGQTCSMPVHLPRSTPAFQKYPPRMCASTSGAVGLSGVASAWLFGLAFMFRQ